MGIFDSKSQDRALGNQSRGSYFKPGLYIVEVDQCKLIKGKTFVVQTQVLGTNSTHPEAPQPGTEASSVWQRGDKDWQQENFIARWWAFLSSALDVPSDAYSDDKWRELTEAAMDEDSSSLKGTVLALKGWSSPNSDYCNVDWLGTPTAEHYAECGIEQGAVSAPGPAPAPAAAAPEPMRAKDPSGKDIISHDGGTSWSFA